MKFTDTKDREYECVVSLQTVIDLKKIGINLNDLFKKDSDLFTRLEDPELLVNALCVVCDESICDQLQGTEEEIATEFARSLGGDTLDNAITAFWTAVASFFPPPQRAALMAIWKKTKSLQQVAMDRIESRVKQLTLETLNASAGSSQGSSA